jgi:hypothetical protein
MNQKQNIAKFVSHLGFFKIMLILLSKLYVAFTKQVNFSDLKLAISLKNEQIS